MSPRLSHPLSPLHLNLHLNLHLSLHLNLKLAALKLAATNPNPSAHFFPPPTNPNPKEYRFSLVLAPTAAPRKKAARVLAEVEDGVVYLRGAEVNAGNRASGLGLLVLRIFTSLISHAFPSPPKTRSINKPVLALSLSRAGYTPDSPHCPIFISPAPTLPQPASTVNSVRAPSSTQTYICHETRSLDWLGTQYPYFFRNSQGLILKSRPDAGQEEGGEGGSGGSGEKKWKKAHVFTTFSAPPPPPAGAGTGAVVHPARAVAFFATVARAAEALAPAEGGGGGRGNGSG